MRDLPGDNDTLYFTPNKTLAGLGDHRWLYNWKGLVLFLVDEENVLKIIKGEQFEEIERIEYECENQDDEENY